MHDPARYGDSFADVYDAWYGGAFDTEGAVEALGALAAGGSVLELGVGTGRLALPLAERGLVVVGVDGSAAMLERLAAKDDGAGVVAVLGDMAELDRLDAVREAAPFAVVVVAYNTFFNLTSDAAQRRCLTQAASLLTTDGTLVIEAYVPADPGAVPRTSLDVRSVDLDGVVLTATEHDPAAQLVTGQHVEIGADGVRLRPWQIRYLDPSQLDERAADAGLVLEARWGGWRGEPFGDASDAHVSLYRRRPSR